MIIFPGGKELHMNKQEYLTLEARCTIETMLDHGESFKTIGISLGKDCTRISKEVKITLPLKKTVLTAKHLLHKMNTSLSAVNLVPALLF